MDFKAMTESIMTAAEQNVKRQLRDDDYLDEKGLLHCGKCGKARQVIVNFFGEDRLVWCICKCRDEELKEAEERQARDRIDMLKRDGFNDPMMAESTFAADGDSECEESIFCRNYVRNFAKFYERGKGLLLTGGVGTGKTFYAACIANALMEDLHPVLFTSVGRYIRGMESEFGGRNEKIEALDKFALVVFDDFGVERNTPYVNELVYSLIDGRVRSGKPMIITTNVPLDEFKAPDNIESGRIYDRILAKCLPIQFSGKNRRRMAIRKDYDEDMELLKGGG